MPRRSGSRGSSSRRGGSRKKNGTSVDFTGVEGRKLIPEGEYNVKVEEVTLETSEESGNEYLAWKFRTIDDDKKYDNQPLFYNTSLQPRALWNLRNLLEALEVEVPDGPMDLDFDELVGLEMIAVVENEKFEGKDRNRLVDFMPMSESGEGGEEKVTVDKDEEEKPRSRRGKKKEDELEPLSEDEVSEMSIEELEEVNEKYDLELDFSKLKTARKKVNAVLDALEDKGYLADDND